LIESGIKARIDRRKSEPSHDNAFLSVSPKFCERWVECFRIKLVGTKASCSSIWTRGGRACRHGPELL